MSRSSPQPPNYPPGTPPLLKFLNENGGNFLGGTLYNDDVAAFVAEYSARKGLIRNCGDRAVIDIDDQLAPLFEGVRSIEVSGLLQSMARHCQDAVAFLRERYENDPGTIAAKKRCRICNPHCCRPHDGEDDEPQR